MTSKFKSLYLSLFALLLFACGDDDGGGGIRVVDSAPPDVQAESCDGELCGGVCVDTESDSANCGGCGLACNSPGQICSGQLPCACPDPVVGAVVEPGGFDTFGQATEDILLGASITLGEKIGVFILYFRLDDALGVELPLMPVDAGNQVTPGLAAAYDMNSDTFEAQTPYAAIEGTMILDSRCAAGASGRATNVRFAEVVSTSNATPVESGCSFVLPTLEFSLGEACES